MQPWTVGQRESQLGEEGILLQDSNIEILPEFLACWLALQILDLKQQFQLLPELAS